MIYCYYYLPVATSKEKVWDILIDKVEHPATYVSGVEEGEFRSLENGTRQRGMQRHGLVVKENIEVNETDRVTRFELEGHPDYEGYIENEVVEENGQTYLRYELRWEGKNGERPQEVQRWLDNTVKSTVDMAENS